MTRYDARSSALWENLPSLLAFKASFKIFILIFWLRWVFVAVHGLFSSCGEWGLLFIVVRGLLIVVSGAQALGAQASVVVAHGLCCSVACGIFLDQGSNPFSPALGCGFLSTAPPRKSSKGLNK